MSPPPAPRPSLRQQKKSETRRRALAASIRLFTENGYEATTVEAIAAEAGIGTRTFFRYFPGKVDVLFADHEERLQLLRECLTNRAAGEPVAPAVERATLVEIDRLLADPDTYLARSRLVASIPAAAARARSLDADFEDVIAAVAAAETGADPDRDLGPRLEARLCWGATRAAQHVWHARGGSSDPRELVRSAFAALDEQHQARQRPA